MTQCPACGDTAESGTGHKTICFDADPKWGLGPRFYVCSRTVGSLRIMIKKYEEKIHLGDWWPWGEVRNGGKK